MKGKLVTVDLVGDVKQFAEERVIGAPLNTVVVERTEKSGQESAKPVDVAKQARFVVQLQDGGSAIKVMAGTRDEALGKIKERLNALKEQPSLSEQDQSILKLLEEVLQEVKQSKSTAATRGKPDAFDPRNPKITPDHRVELKRVVQTRYTSNSPDKKTEIDMFREQVKKLTKQLAAAQHTLSVLEGSGPHTAVLHVEVDPRRTVEKIYTSPGTADKKKEVVHYMVVGKPKQDGKAKQGPEAKAIKIDPRSIETRDFIIGSHPGSEPPKRELKIIRSDEKRIEELEIMLKKLMKEVEGLKKGQAK